MRNALKTLLWTIGALMVFDLLVALVLMGPAPASLKRFFDYGLSVPGKLAQWQDTPQMRGNLTEVAWLPALAAGSAEKFAHQDSSDPVLRGYGMSFTNHISKAAQEVSPTLELDLHSGPGAPPNFTFAAFQADRASRSPGDIVTLGVLSSTLPAMGSFSNRVWAFEQPAPFTYPIYTLDASGQLSPELPVIQSLSDELRRRTDPELNAAWEAQLKQHDRLYSPVAFAARWLDASPFARLVRRAWAIDAIGAREARVLSDPTGDPYPFAEVLREMCREFAEQARADGLHPIVIAVQSRDPKDPVLEEILAPFLEEQGIPFLLTSRIVSARDPAAFLGDGHYSHEANLLFGAELAKLIREAN